jgi:UDP-3-O-[3-hydroxymyristoyl] N-acetylglucosamine deacetylase
MDGSSRAFVAGFAEVGLVRSGRMRRAIQIVEPVEVEADGRYAALFPAPAFSLRFEIAFDDPAIGRQEIDLAMSGDAFAEELAECRTFGQLAEVEQLRRIGLARGGSLENAIVIDRGRVLNVGGLRRADEFVRHKVLDAVGDLALAGAPIIGRYEGVKAGHEMTNRLLRALFDRPSAWRYVPLGAKGMTLGRGPDRRTAEAASIAV